MYPFWQGKVLRSFCDHIWWTCQYSRKVMRLKHVCFCSLMAWWRSKSYRSLSSSPSRSLVLLRTRSNFETSSCTRSKSKALSSSFITNWIFMFIDVVLVQIGSSTRFTIDNKRIHLVAKIDESWFYCWANLFQASIIWRVIESINLYAYLPRQFTRCSDHIWQIKQTKIAFSKLSILVYYWWPA